MACQNISVNIEKKQFWGKIFECLPKHNQMPYPLALAFRSSFFGVFVVVVVVIGCVSYR